MRLTGDSSQFVYCVSPHLNLLYQAFCIDTVLIHSCPSEQDIGPLPLQLVSAFGLVIQCRDSAGKHSLLTQTIHTLKQAVQPGKPLYSSCLEFSTQDYKEVKEHTLLYQKCLGVFNTSTPQ